MTASPIELAAPGWLLELLACPLCKSELRKGPTDLACTSCGRRYPLTARGQPDLRIELPSEDLQPPIVSAPRGRRLLHRVRRAVRRRIDLAQAAIGSRVECNYCGWRGRNFLPSGNPPIPNRLCPNCGSIERYRALKEYLRRHSRIESAPTVLLEVARTRPFRAWCLSLPTVRYIAADLMTEGAMVFTDLTRAGIRSGSIDILVCMHVLEHIPDDAAAFREIRRVLSPQGFGIIAVPIHRERTFEDPATPPSERAKVYGQFDHVRIYGFDIVERMRREGLEVEVVDLCAAFSEEERRRHALVGHDRHFFRVSPG